MLPNKLWFIWPNGFREEFLKSANQKQESSVVAMFDNGSGRNEHCLHVSTRQNSYVQFDWSIIFRVRIAKNVLIFKPDPKNNQPIKSHVGIRPRTDMQT